MALSLLLAAALSPQQAPVDFAREIRPLLSDRCFTCHGPDEAAREGGFRLDVREGALAHAIVPHDAAASELLARIEHDDPGERMPPPASKLSLTEREVALLERWIEEGAPYAEHWAFVPPRRSVPDALVDSAWARDPLDRFIEDGLHAAALAPAAPIDRAAWLRRVSFDLTGLPPSLAELDAFANDQADGAHERQVERLFASPRHAERMATIWLDAARYADTYGYQADVQRPVWPWRDWVLSAFERNLPYDDFLTWQIAGDLLPDATHEQQLATAFNRLHRQTNEGGSTEEEYRVEYVADRVDTLGEAVLGLTLGCARCHDHKFDPLSQRGYYALSAFFDDIDESGLYSHFTNATPTPALDLPTDAQRAKLAALEQSVLEAEAELARVRAAAQGPVSVDWSLAPHRSRVAHFSFESLEGRKLANDFADDKPGSAAGPLTHAAGRHGNALAFTGDDAATFGGIGAFRRSDPFTIGIDLWLDASYARAVVLHRSRAWHDAGSRGYELLIEDGRPSAALVHFWPGDALRVVAREPLPVRKWVHVAMTYDGSSRAAGLRLFVEGLPVEVDVVRDGLQRQIVGGGEGALTLGERFRDNGFKGGRMDELSVFGRELAPHEVRALVRRDEGASWTEAETAESQLREHDDVYRGALEAVRAARRARDDEQDRVRQIMTMRDMPEPRTAYLLHRGEYGNRLEPVAPGLPFAVLATGRPPRNRRDLAAWLTHPAHPLTARVEVNRLWQMCFGTGLVSTPEDFGSQGDPPSHPALLDELALDFIESGWDRQALLKRFLLSATYRQASTPTAAAHEVDPDNRLLSHMPRKRLTAEMLRDAALLHAGLLVEQRGGPPVKPYQPAGLWKEKSGQTYVPDQGAGLWRRSLYTIWKRTSPPPTMMIFDAAKRDVCVVQRQATSSPLQALVLWNDPQFVEAARKLGERMLREGGDTHAARAAFAFRLATSRAPAERELAILVQLAETQHAAFTADPDAAASLATFGQAPPPGELPLVDVATCAVVAQTILSFDAALTLP